MSPTPNLSRRMAASLLALVFALGPAACGDDGGGGGSTLDALARAADRTSSVETIDTRVEIRFVDVPGLEDQSSVTQVVGTLDGTEGKGTTTVNGQTIDMIIVDETYYYGAPGLPDGKRWARLTFDELKDQTGIDVAAASGQSAVQPLELMRASGDVIALGEEDVDGVPTTHYRGTVDVDAANERTQIYTPEALAQAKGLLGEQFEIDVWIDADDFVRRISYEADLSEAPDLPAGMPDEGRIVYLFEMSDFGIAVDVTAPPDDEVVDLADLN